MIFGRKDYDSPDGMIGIPDDEPVFLLRAQDRLSIEVVDAWIAAAERDGVDQKMITSAKLQVSRMIRWQADHGVKTPTDVPSD